MKTRAGSHRPQNSPSTVGSGRTVTADGVSQAAARLGIRKNCDWLLHLPLRYEDETAITPIAHLVPDQPAQVIATVLDTRITFRPRRQLVCEVQDESGARLILRFMNFYASQQKALQKATRLCIFGKMRQGPWGPEMVHPRYRPWLTGMHLPQVLTPIYPITRGITQKRVQSLVEAAWRQCPIVDTLPEALRARWQLMPLALALQQLHHPGTSNADLEPAWRRVRFDELLAQQLRLRQVYLQRKRYPAVALVGDSKQCDAFVRNLPFQLTATQQKIWKELQSDLAQSFPMRRLLQGDVGSGKTVLAFLALVRACDLGFQGALMAPTEVLMEQHFAKLSAWCAPLSLTVRRLGSASSRQERREIRELASSGAPCLIVGTHALIEKDVRFANLALAVVDEQHHFGVEQRLHFGRGEQHHPHLLMMSATPIPRTLAMSLCADLDLSILDEMPPGRQPVLTKLISQERRAEVLQRLQHLCQHGGQGYWVCPLIEEDETLATVLATHRTLTEKLAPIKVELLHGQMPAAEKRETMARFVAGEIQLLVATTVIEVGVDVPNATVMVIEHAERFGLAQLHQLRGRVGRGSHRNESSCILLYSADLTPTAIARLKIIYESTDGFAIAARDLQLRGPGEFLGTRQSGAALLRYADLGRDEALVESVREAASALLHEAPELADAHIERWQLHQPSQASESSKSSETSEAG